MDVRLLAKRLVFPGFDIATRKRMRLARHFRTGDIETLDAGCGNGAFSFAAVRRGNRVTGIDSDKEKLARCIAFRDYLGIPSDRCAFLPLPICATASIGKSFDQIICFETLEHIVDDAAAVRTLAGALKPGGLLHISTPQRERKPYYGEVISSVEDGNHVRLGYTLADFERLLTPVGCTVIRHETLVGFWGQRLINLLNWVDHRLLAAAPPTLRDAVNGFILILLYPLTFIDPLIPGADLIVCITAQNHA
jgi:SAM-dependent methyltransferase